MKRCGLVTGNVFVMSSSNLRESENSKFERECLANRKVFNILFPEVE